MSNPWRTIGYIILGIIAVSITLKVLGILTALIFNIVLPLAVVAGIGYVVYLLVRGKSLGGSGRSLP